jgi:metallo-beta-lactamase superfamily protein
MAIKLYAMTCGHLTGELGRLMEGGEGRIRIPVPAYLIEHPKGLALFDSGMHPDCQRDPAARVGARISGLFEFDYRPGEEVSARLMAMGRDPARLDILINSHFHFDHVGGNALVANATMLVQRREWEAALDPDIAAPHGFNRRDFDLGHKLLLLDGEHDVFGDGSGHMPADLWPHAGAPVAENAARQGRSRAGRRCLLFLPHVARAPIAPAGQRPCGDAGLARPVGCAGSGRRPHLLRARPGFLEDRAAGAGADRLTGHQTPGSSRQRTRCAYSG